MELFQILKLFLVSDGSATEQGRLTFAECIAAVTWPAGAASCTLLSIPF